MKKMETRSLVSLVKHQPEGGCSTEGTERTEGRKVRQAENPTSTLLSMNLDIFSGSRQVQDPVQQKPSQTTALNMARYRKAVSSAVWVQLALVVCYVLKICNAGCDHL